MGMERIANSAVGNLIVRGLAAGMESRLRYRFFGPTNILQGADILPGQKVLEVGCGTGYFTLPAARLIGEHDCLVAIDVLSGAVNMVSAKARAANLNVRVVRADALNTGLQAGSFDKVLLFGVIPAPMLPLDRLLLEMHRVLKAEGTLAVWPHVPGWLPQSIVRSELFAYAGRKNGVSLFKRCEAGGTSRVVRE